MRAHQSAAFTVSHVTAHLPAVKRIDVASAAASGLQKTRCRMTDRASKCVAQNGELATCLEMGQRPRCVCKHKLVTAWTIVSID